MDPAASAYAGKYISILMPALYFNACGDSIDLFLSGIGKIEIVAVIQACMIPFHALVCWLFVCRL